ncbi:MAG: transglycosylase family protein [Solirubrobacteraceae bacterium]
MKRLILAASLVLAALALPASALAHSNYAICHDGSLSDDVGQGCTNDWPYIGHGNAICYDGILSDDVGQGCTNDGGYVTTSTAAPAVGSAPSYSGYGGSSNSMVNPNCESSGNSQAVSPDGRYWGKYQFDYSTWVASGGAPGDYGHASAAVQDSVAARVTYDAWPNC